MQKIRNDIQIIDDVLSEKDIIEIHGSFVLNGFPWYMVSGSVVLKDNQYIISTSPLIQNLDSNIFEAFQLCHDFIFEHTACSDRCGVPDYILKKLTDKIDLSEYNYVQRIKANFQSKFLSDPDCYNTPHYDNLNEHLVIIYYVNDSDGDTFIFENDKYPLKIKKRVSPKAGRFVIFNGNHFHAGIHPKSNDYRIVINFNLMKNNSSNMIRI